MRRDGAPVGLYGAALLAFAVGGALCGTFAVDAVRKVQGIGERPVFEVPGEYLVEAPVPGRYDALHVPGERAPDTAPLPARLSFRLVEEAGDGPGDAVPGVFAAEPGVWTTEINGRAVRPLVSFDVERPGRYRLDVRATTEEPVHARVVFGPDLEGAVDASFRALLWAALAGLGAFFIGTPLFVIGLLVHGRRRRMA